MVIYLAGKVLKGSEIGTAQDWRKEYYEVISQAGNFDFLSPDDPDLDENFPELVFGHDCYQVRECDIVVVNASSKLGVGTAQEMLIAKYFGKPVLVVLPKDTHHRRSNLDMHGRTVADWIHPFIFTTADVVVDSLHELSLYLKENVGGLRSRQVKSLGVIDETIERYLESVNS
jgi:hypothetical protein